MGRMGRIHDLSHSLRSHDEARERRNGVLNQRGCSGSFPTLVPANRGVFLSRYRFLMKKFYKNAKASFYISSGMDTAESSTVIR